MPITITTKTAVVSVQVDMTVDDANLLIACLPELPFDRPLFWALATFLEILSDRLDVDHQSTAIGGILTPQPPAPPVLAYSPPGPESVPESEAGTIATATVRRKAHRDTKRKKIDCDWLHEQYITLGRSTTDIALELACSSSTISKYLREYGIPARNDGWHRRPLDPTPAPAKMNPGSGYAGTSFGRGASAGSSD